MCKVMADSLDELIRWGKRNGLRRIHFSRNGKPHFDLWGPLLAMRPHPSEMRYHWRLYRSQFIGRRSMSHDPGFFARSSTVTPSQTDPYAL
jgi:hypothetical protein